MAKRKVYSAVTTFSSLIPKDQAAYAVVAHEANLLAARFQEDLESIPWLQSQGQQVSHFTDCPGATWDGYAKACVTISGILTKVADSATRAAKEQP